MKKTLSEVEAHTLNGDLECEVCGEWVPDFDVTIVKINKYDGHKNVCSCCIEDSNEFTGCTACGDTFHIDLMHGKDTCKECFEDMRITPVERVS